MNTIPTFCCKMRQKFLIGIMAENTEVPQPSDVLDYLDFEQKTEDGRPILRIKYCPFCGVLISGPLRVG